MTVTNSSTPGSDSARAAVFASSVSPSGSRMNAFGAISRDKGHSRVPAPPERITGMRSGAAGIRSPLTVQDLESARVYPMLSVEVVAREMPVAGGIMTVSMHCSGVHTLAPCRDDYRG